MTLDDYCDNQISNPVQLEKLKNCNFQPHIIFLAQYHITRSIIVKLKDYQWSSEDLLIGQDWSETNPCPMPNTILCLETSTRGDEADYCLNWFGIETKQLHVILKLSLPNTHTNKTTWFGWNQYRLWLSNKSRLQKAQNAYQSYSIRGYMVFRFSGQILKLTSFTDYSGGSIPSKISTWSKFCMTHTRHPIDHV